jgi:two-component system response regulator CpxR
MLPNKNGFEIIKAVREHSDVPLLVLSARKENLNRSIALELGADDYLTKPCSHIELIARIHAILRRAQKSPPTRPVIKFHNIIVDGTKRQAFVSGALIDLTNTEFNILEMLIKSPGQAFSKEELTEYALGRAFTAYDRSIDVHISNLRNKLGDNTSGEPWLKTVRGFGYMFNVV